MKRLNNWTILGSLLALVCFIAGLFFPVPPSRCPKCSSQDIVPLQYVWQFDGLSPDGKIFYGGGCHDMQPGNEWYCKNCKNRFSSLYRRPRGVPNIDYDKTGNVITAGGAPVIERPGH